MRRNRDAQAPRSGSPVRPVSERTDDMIACLLSSDGYGVWHVPIVSGQVPA